MTAQNTTINATGMSTLWCPSDPGVDSRNSRAMCLRRFVPFADALQQLRRLCRHLVQLPVRHTSATTQQNGVFYAFSVDQDLPRSRTGRATRSCSASTPVRSRTQGDQTCWHWWTSGNYGDTICTTFLPINPQKKLPVHLPGRRTSPAVEAVEPASRRGECRLLRRLGSVRQEESELDEQSQQHRGRSTCVPNGITATTLSSGDFPIWSVTQVGMPVFGVYQQLSTRNGGETVSSDQY